VVLKLAGFKRTKIKGGRRKLRNEERHDFDFLPVKEGKGNSHGILVGKPERERTFKRTRHRWEENIEMDLKSIRWDGVD
jgi:hypothetical protein